MNKNIAFIAFTHSIQALHEENERLKLELERQGKLIERLVDRLGEE